MPDGTVPLLLSLILLILLSGFFSATETAYSCANRIRLRSKEKTYKHAKKVLKLAEENYDKFITTVLIGNNIVNLTAATLSALFFSKILSSEINYSLISTVVITVAVLIFGEITPKFIAKTYPERFACFFYPLVITFYYVLYPFNLIFSGWKWFIGKVFRLKNNEIVTEDEIITVAIQAEEDGSIRKDETKLIKQVIEFDDLEVGDILIPRVNIVAVEKNDKMDYVKSVFEKEGYSRLPVYKKSIDTVIGTIHEKDFIKSYLKGENNIENIIKPALFTTEHIKISKLLKQLQKKKTHISIVLDEYGGTLGLVTLEDVLEELVGEIFDEHDEEINYIRKTSKTEYVVDGNCALSDFGEKFNLSGLDNFESDTVSGWVIEYLGEIPPKNKKFSFDNLEIEVLLSSVKKVLQIKITLA